MKNKTLLIISLLMIAFLIGTSYTPQTALAERKMQEEQVAQPEDILIDYSKDILLNDVPIQSDADVQDGVAFGEDSAKLDGENQLLSQPAFGFYSAVGINFVPHDSRITRYNGAKGCLGSGYDGDVRKVYSLNLNMPEDVRGSNIYFTYYNNVAAPANGPITVTLFRRYYEDLTTEVLKTYRLEQTGQGEKHYSWEIDDLIFDTNYWFYWIEFHLPKGTNEREFCGFQIAYKNHSIFPIALPLVTNR